MCFTIRTFQTSYSLSMQKTEEKSWLPAYSFYNFHGKLIFMHLFGGCFDIFPSRIVVVEWCYTITILASLFILYFFSILATLLTTSFCAVFVSFLFMDILGLLGAESKKAVRGTSRRGRSNVENEINVRRPSTKA